MRIKKKPNINKWIKKVENTPNLLYRLGNEIIATIINRTQRGTDANNKPFKRYTAQYAQQKQEEFGGKKVNLTRTQNMLNSIRYRKYRNGIRLYFSNKEENKKAYNNQVKNNRYFFSLTPKEMKRVKNELTKLFKF